MWNIPREAGDFARYLRWAQQTSKTAGDECDFPHNAPREQR
jgi:hypothetical protein